MDGPGNSVRLLSSSWSLRPRAREVNDPPHDHLVHFTQESAKAVLSAALTQTGQVVQARQLPLGVPRAQLLQNHLGVRHGVVRVRCETVGLLRGIEGQLLAKLTEPPLFCSVSRIEPRHVPGFDLRLRRGRDYSEVPAKAMPHLVQALLPLLVPVQIANEQDDIRPRVELVKLIKPRGPRRSPPSGFSTAC